ncbi:MAG: hypothetical protein EXQ77_02660 [Thermoleophilia bacterium]|nr:hypothetical protein [Thermoleophilia bacterium]
MTTTPWGTATTVEAVSVKQRAGEQRFETWVELLETRSGERLVRVAYSTDGRARRGPVTLRAADVEKLRQTLSRASALRDALLGHPD